MAVQRRLKAKLVEIISYSDRVKLFKLKPEKRVPRFKPGQFLHLAIDPYDPSFNWPESRVFSLANSPSREGVIEVLVSKVGSFTTKMFETLDVGNEVWIKLPYGTFNFDESADRNTVLIAGGTGISPFVSFLQYAIDKELNTAINLNYGVRNRELLIIEDLIIEAKSKLNNFDYRIHLEENSASIPNIDLQEGMLPVEKIVTDSLKLDNAIYYLSGPPVMIVAFDEELKKNGVQPENIKYDNWE